MEWVNRNPFPVARVRRLPMCVPQAAAYAMRFCACAQGPKDTAYEGGRFELIINVPEQYPLQPPAVRYKTKCFHPNFNFKVRPLLHQHAARTHAWRGMPSCANGVSLQWLHGCVQAPVDAAQPGHCPHACMHP